VLEQCNVLLQLVSTDTQRVVPLIFTQLSIKDVIISDWSHKVSSFYLFHCADNELSVKIIIDSERSTAWSID